VRGPTLDVSNPALARQESASEHRKLSQRSPLSADWDSPMADVRCRTVDFDRDGLPFWICCFERLPW
jgi:hypothetical protein